MELLPHVGVSEDGGPLKRKATQRFCISAQRLVIKQHCRKALENRNCNIKAFELICCVYVPRPPPKKRRRGERWTSPGDVSGDLTFRRRGWLGALPGDERLGSLMKPAQPIIALDEHRHALLDDSLYINPCASRAWGVISIISKLLKAPQCDTKRNLV